MACSCSSRIASTAQHFDDNLMREELATYRSAGPRVTTRGLLDQLGTIEAPIETVLDIGSGIGALAIGLLKTGVRRATCVDLSRAALAAGAEEAERQEVATRIDWVEGDFVAIASRVPCADLVVLDRVVCCYPDFAPLLHQASAHSRHVLAMSYPRGRWWVRLGLWIENGWRRLRGDGFRAFLHSPAAMEELLAHHGFHRARVASTWTWQIAAYIKNAS